MLNSGRSPQRRREDENLSKRVVSLRWVYSLNAGGRKQRMSVFVVVGNGNGRVGYGIGKAKDTSSAVKKAITQARQRMTKFHMKHGRTVHHDITTKYCSSIVQIKSALPGSGIKCSSSARLFVECLGMKDIVIKSHKSSNPINLIKALSRGLSMIRSPYEVAKRRGVTYERVLGRPAKIAPVVDS
jgi:small subunit ribosomal protein S5